MLNDEQANEEILETEEKRKQKSLSKIVMGGKKVEKCTKSYKKVLAAVFIAASGICLCIDF